MGKILTDSRHYAAIASAIREKAGITAALTPAAMAEAIEAITLGNLTDEEVAQIDQQLESLLQDADQETMAGFTIAEKLNVALLCRALILAAIRSKGVTVPEDQPLRTVAQLIQQIPTDGSGAFNIICSETEPEDTTKLWVKCSEPNSVQVTAVPTASSETLEEFVSARLTSTSGIAAAAVGTKVYLFGGGSDTSIYVLDTQTHTLSTLAAMLPDTLSYGAAAAVGKKIYLFGGTSGNTAIYQLDTETETVSTLSATMAYGYKVTAVPVGTKIYLFGGYQGGYTTSIRVFNTETETYHATGAVIDAKVSSMAAAAVGTKIYIFGGNGSASSLYDAYIFDTTDYTVSTCGTQSGDNVVAGMAAVAWGSRIYLFGGHTHTEAIRVFDTESQQFTTLSAVIPGNFYNGSAAATVGTAVYLFPNGTGIHRFVMQLPLGTNNLLIEACGTENLFPLLPAVELGVKNVYLGNGDGVAERVEAALYHDNRWAKI